MNRSSNCLHQPLVSVVVPIYNGETDLPELISCLRSQTYPKVEYLLVDNNSSDGTQSILQTASQEFSPGTYRNLTEKKIQSSYAARNRGIQAAMGEIIALTDVDCRPQSDWLEQLIQPFLNPNIGIVAGEILAQPGDSLLEKYARANNTLSQKFCLEHPFCPYGQTANLAIRKEAFLQVGLFRPYLDTGGDADICWRILQQTETEIEFAPLAIVLHRHRSDLKELKSQWRRYGRSNRYLHQLHGVNLMRELSNREIAYRLSRWFLKELPLFSLKATIGKGDFIDLIKTPIDLICFGARTKGQKETHLTLEARQIEYLGR